MSIFDIFKKLDEEKAAKASQPIEWIVIGLGNPGGEVTTTLVTMLGFPRALEGYAPAAARRSTA